MPISFFDLIFARFCAARRAAVRRGPVFSHPDEFRELQRMRAEVREAREQVKLFVSQTRLGA